MADPITPPPPDEVPTKEKINRQAEMELVKLGSYYGTANQEQRQNIIAAIGLLNAAMLSESLTRAQTLLSLGRRTARLTVMPNFRKVAPEEQTNRRGPR